MLNFFVTMTSLNLVISECCPKKAGRGGSADRKNMLRSVSSSVKGLFTAAELGVLVGWSRRRLRHGLHQDLAQEGGILDADNDLVPELAPELSRAPL